MENKDITVILCPFINTEVLQDMLSNKLDKNVVIVTSWRQDHFSGVSNLDLYDVIKKNNSWRLYVNDNLHAKVYSLDLDSAFIGSANFYSALLDEPNSNHEV